MSDLTHSHEYADFYPDVTRAGSMRDALQADMDHVGHGLTAELPSSPGWRLVGATARVGDRSAHVLMTPQQRLFGVDCWSGGVHMARGNTDELSDVAGAFHTWLGTARVRELVDRWPFLRTWELAEAHERGDAIPVRWRQLREFTTNPRGAALHDLVEAAFEQPRLRVLSPGRSMYWLTFSRSAAPPICRDLPGAMPLGDNRYRVRFADGRTQEVDGAVQAVALIVAALPADIACEAADGLPHEGRDDT